jgi:hypothetical protein
MNIKNLKDQELLSTLKNKTQIERNLTLEIIELLEEVDRRKLHLEIGFGSLLDFCVKELKYSESAAYRRISAMRVAKEVPEVKKSIAEGSLNLVNIAQAQTFFNQERKYNHKIYTQEEKKVLVLNLENKSKRECEKILIEKSPELPKQEKVRPVSKEQSQITITVDQKLMDKLEKIKSKYSHINPNPTYAELFELMADKLLQTNKHRSNATPLGEKTARHTRYISAAIKHEVYMRDGGCCSYVDPKTGQKCNSKFQLQLDHKFPFALGGENSLENLRLVCANHNRFMIKRALG